MFTNGFGYNYTHNGTHVLWRNLTSVDTDDIDFRQLAAVYQPDGEETHGGEDVAAYAIGNVMCKKNALSSKHLYIHRLYM